MMFLQTSLWQIKMSDVKVILQLWLDFYHSGFNTQDFALLKRIKNRSLFSQSKCELFEHRVLTQHNPLKNKF